MQKSRIDTLRISVTDHCNLSCIYCSPKNKRGSPSSSFLAFSDLIKIAAEFMKHGVTRFKITGGEPFCREGLVDFIREFGKLAVSDISIATNGTLAEPYLDDLYSAGLKRITFSLDALSEKIYRELSGENLLKNVWASINKSLEIGFNPIKLNAVIIRGVNEDEILRLASLTISNKFNLRFIELMKQAEEEDDWTKKHVPSKEIKDAVEKNFGALIETKRSNDGPHVKVYKIPEATGNIGFISPNSERFCDGCTKLRLTSGGIAKTCLRSHEALDLKPALGNSSLLSELVAKIINMKTEQLHRIWSKKEIPTRICHPMGIVGG